MSRYSCQFLYDMFDDKLYNVADYPIRNRKPYRLCPREYIVFIPVSVYIQLLTGAESPILLRALNYFRKERHGLIVQTRSKAESMIQLIHSALRTNRFKPSRSFSQMRRTCSIKGKATRLQTPRSPCRPCQRMSPNRSRGYSRERKGSSTKQRNWGGRKMCQRMNQPQALSQLRLQSPKG